jgi:hypothetical protein
MQIKSLICWAAVAVLGLLIVVINWRSNRGRWQ